MRPCCMSTPSQSRPWCAITSAENALGIESHPPRAGRSSCQSFLIAFSRMFPLLAALEPRLPLFRERLHALLGVLGVHGTGALVELLQPHLLVQVDEPVAVSKTLDKLRGDGRPLGPAPGPGHRRGD